MPFVIKNYKKRQTYSTSILHGHGGTAVTLSDSQLCEPGTVWFLSSMLSPNLSLLMKVSAKYQLYFIYIPLQYL